MSIERIVVINDTCVSAGGAGALALQSIRSFRARGLPVTFLCGDQGDNPELFDLKVPVHSAAGAELLKRPAHVAAVNGVYDTRMRNFVAQFIRDHDTPETIYHVHAWAQIFSPAIFAALAQVAERCFVHAHDMFLACPNGVYMDYQGGQVCTRRPLSISCAAKHCDKRSYLHKAWRLGRHMSLRRSFDTRRNWAGLFQIHPGMTPGLLRAGIPDHLIRTLRNPVTPYAKSRIRAEDNSGILYVGRLEEDKGALAFAQAAERCGVLATFVGDGPLRDQIEHTYPDFPVTGWLQGDEIGRIAQQMCALVMPSRHPEPFAMVLPEAIHSGLPALVSDTAFMADEIEGAGLGLKFTATDAADFDRVLRTVAAMSGAELQAMSARGFDAEQRLALT